MNKVFKVLIIWFTISLALALVNMGFCDIPKGGELSFSMGVIRGICVLFITSTIVSAVETKMDFPERDAYGCRIRYRNSDL